MARTPDEILTVLDEAQARLGEEFDLRSLMWEVIGDISTSYELAIDGVLARDPKLVANTAVAIHNEVADYIGNNYGDD